MILTKIVLRKKKGPVVVDPRGWGDPERREEGLPTEKNLSEGGVPNRDRRDQGPIFRTPSETIQVVTRDR